MVFTPSVGECYAYSLEYTGEPILRVLIFKGINMFPSIKSYRTENNCVFSVHQLCQAPSRPRDLVLRKSHCLESAPDVPVADSFLVILKRSFPPHLNPSPHITLLYSPHPSYHCLLITHIY